MRGIFPKGGGAGNNPKGPAGKEPQGKRPPKGYGITRKPRRPPKGDGPPKPKK